MSFIHGVHIADGFADDCDELIHRCLQVETLTFEVFSDIWKDMQLSCIFQGRSSGAEIAELSEEVIHIAKHYMVADTSNFEESVAGLFLVYSLMHLQPYSTFASLRIVQEDVPALERIELVARRNRRPDVLYVLGSVLIQGPVQYHAVLRERGMEFPIRKYLEGYSTIDKLGVRPKGVFYRQNTELDIIRELKNLTVRYTIAKESIPGVKPDDRNLNYLDASFANDLDNSLKKLISGIIDDENDGDSSTSCDAIKNIKDKAMKAQVKPIRHRMAVANTSRNSIKPGTNGSPKKEKPRSSKRGKKRVRKTSDSSEDSDYTAKYSDSGTIDELASDDDLDLTKFDQAVTQDKSCNEIECEIDPFNSMHSQIGKSFDIEFIDHLEQPSTSGLNSPSTAETTDMHKRDLKKTILKSRFKRMGMLPVANFESK